MKRLLGSSWSLSLASWLLACGGGTGGGERPDADGGSPDGGGDAAGPGTDGPTARPGHPLGVDSSALPFPSSYYLAQDATTPTGLRVALRASDLPVALDGALLDPAPWNRADGFSPNAPILARLDAPLDGANLAPPRDPARSLAADSPTVILDLETGERVAHFAELDRTAGADERQALILRPMQRLALGRRYAVALTDALRGADGAALAPTPGFRAILDGAPGHPGLERIRGGYDAIFAALAGAGLARERLLLAWDFVTCSQAHLTRDLLAMRDATLAWMGELAADVPWGIDEVEARDDGEVLRVIRGWYEIPNFLTGGEAGYDSLGGMARGADGLPEQRGTLRTPFTMVIPAVAAGRAPLPLVVYGHGLLGDGGEVLAGNLRRLAQTHGYVMVAHDWTGFSERDVAAAIRGLADPNLLHQFFDRMHLGVLSPIVLTRVARHQLAADPAAADDDGASFVDPAQVYYYGNSQGGIFGATFMAYSTEIARGVLGVGGGNYSLMLQRSVDWPSYALVLETNYPEALDSLMLIELMQALWDPTDGINGAPHWFDPLPGTPAKRILSMAAIGDSQVPNLATDIVARTAGQPVLAPTPREVYGIAASAGPLDSALTYWWFGAEPIKTNDVTGEDNGVHGDLRGRRAAQEQIARFLRPDGRVEQTCGGGVCDCAAGACD